MFFAAGSRGAAARLEEECMMHLAVLLRWHFWGESLMQQQTTNGAGKLTLVHTYLRQVITNSVTKQKRLHLQVLSSNPSLLPRYVIVESWHEVGRGFAAGELSHEIPTFVPSFMDGFI